MAEELEISTKLNKDFVVQNKSQEEIKGLIKLWPNERTFDQQSKVNSHIILVLDSSGSMDESFSDNLTKREAVVKAAQEILKVLDPEDKVSVITYNSSATVLAKELAGNKRDEILTAIKKIDQFSGSTNFERAMKVSKRVATKGNSNIIFLTDGKSNAGDDEEAFRLVEELSSEGIITNAMGIGSGFRYEFMKNFSHPGNGITENLNNLDRARNIFLDISQSAQWTVIKNAFLKISFPSYLRDLEFYQQTPEKKVLDSKITRQPDGSALVELNIGDLVLNQSNNYVFSVELSTSEQASMLLAEMRIDYSVPGMDIQNRTEDRRIDLNLTDDPADRIIHSSIDDEYRDVSLTKLWLEVEELLDEEEYVEAGRKLRNMIKLASKLDSNLEKKYRKSYKELQNNGRLSVEQINEMNRSSTVSSLHQRAGEPDKEIHDAKTESPI